MAELSLSPDEVLEFMRKLPYYDETGSQSWNVVREMCSKHGLNDPNELIDAILVLGNQDSKTSRLCLEQLGLLYLCRATRGQLYAWADMLENTDWLYELDVVWGMVRWSQGSELFRLGDYDDFRLYVFFPFLMKSLLYIAARIGFPKRILLHYILRSWFWCRRDFMDWKPQDRDLGSGEFNIYITSGRGRVEDNLQFLRNARRYFDFDYEVNAATNSARVTIH